MQHARAGLAAMASGGAAAINTASIKACPRPADRPNGMRLAVLSYADGGGGGGIAVHRLHQAIGAAGIESRMLVRRRTTDDPTVEALARPGMGDRVAALIQNADRLPLQLYRRRSGTTWSPGLAGLPGIERHPAVQAADLLLLGWVNGGFLSLGGIGRLLRLEKPVIWRLSDMWPLTGGRHYAEDCLGYTAACGCCPQLGSRRAADLSRFGLRRRAGWPRDRLTLVAPSRWMADKVQRSSLFRDLPVEVIPTGVDLEVYRPLDRSEARRQLALPLERPLLLFAAMNPGSEPRKGFAHLEGALAILAAEGAAADLELVIFGAGGPPAGVPFPQHHLGRLDDEAAKVLAYAAADVFVAPSTADNLPNTVIEAMAAGLPAVAFDVGGLPELIEDGRSGHLVPLGDQEALAGALARLIAEPERRHRFGQAARAKALAHHDSEALTRRYVELFQDRLARRSRL
jgi:glycosyltransferase involved in cell wall biosynthesis